MRSQCECWCAALTLADRRALSDSDDEVVETAADGKAPNGKGKEKEKGRRRVELTPPPDTSLDPEKRARMKKVFE